MPLNLSESNISNCIKSDCSKVDKYKKQKSSDDLFSAFVFKRDIKNSNASGNTKSVDDIQYRY